MPMEEIGRWSRREAGLLSSQKQEIQVCERTRPNGERETVVMSVIYVARPRRKRGRAVRLSLSGWLAAADFSFAIRSDFFF